MRGWHILPIVIALIINSVGWGVVYYHIRQLPGKPSASDLESAIKSTNQIMAQLAQIQDQLTQLQYSPTSTVLGTTSVSTRKQLSDLLPDVSNTTATASDRIITVPKNSTSIVNVYKEQADFSAIIGQLIPDYKYSYTVKLSDWYLVNLADGKVGWVKASEVVLK